MYCLASLIKITNCYCAEAQKNVGFFCQSANEVAILGTYLQFRSKTRASD